VGAGTSSDQDRNTGYNQGSRSQSTDIGSEGRGQGSRQGTEGRTENQGASLRNNPPPGLQGQFGVNLPVRQWYEPVRFPKQ